MIFAVRISMSLPALFQAVRLYRSEASPVQDDFGRTLIDQGEPLHLPLVSAQELWFSDGGITSNFPVHFFDNSLPRWPTVSLNLGTHPEGAPSRHLAAPGLGRSQHSGQDAGARAGLRPGDLQHRHVVAGQPAIGFAGLSQPDRPSSHQPGRGRANLFMPREIIASMALRGWREPDCVRGSRTMRSGIASVGCGCVPP